MITIKQVYDAYPSSDLLPIAAPGSEGAAEDLDDIEAMSADIGDTLFLFLCRELCSEKDEVDITEAARRLNRIIRDLVTVRDRLAQVTNPQYPATLLVSQLGSIFQARPGHEFSIAFGKSVMYFKQPRVGEFMVSESMSGPQKSVGNAYGAARAYMDMLQQSQQLVTVPNV